MSADHPRDTEDDGSGREGAEEDGGDGTTLVLVVGFLVLANVIWLSFLYM